MSNSNTPSVMLNHVTFDHVTYVSNTGWIKTGH